MTATDNMRTRLAELRYNGLDHVALVEVEECLDAIGRELKEAYVPLPNDADGTTIRVGDVVRVDPVIAFDGERVFEVRSISLDESGCWDLYDRMGNCALSWHTRIHKPTTVEDVLWKALNEAAMLDRKEGYWPSAADITNLVNELAPKLQLRERSDD